MTQPQADVQKAEGKKEWDVYCPVCFSRYTAMDNQTAVIYAAELNRHLKDALREKKPNERPRIKLPD